MGYIQPLANRKVGAFPSHQAIVIEIERPHFQTQSAAEMNGAIGQRNEADRG